MTISEYNKLTQEFQFEKLYNDGVHISDRADDEYCIILFQLFDFYVELHFHIEHNSLKKVVVFNNADFLKPYLELIDISELFIKILK